MRVIVTISRDFDDYDAVLNKITALSLGTVTPVQITIVHGASQMDWFAAGIACALGMEHEPHPADWERLKKGAGFVRNQEMVDAGADLCIAFIKDCSHGATDCAARADEAGIAVEYVRRLFAR